MAPVCPSMKFCLTLVNFRSASPVSEPVLTPELTLETECFPVNGLRSYRYASPMMHHQQKKGGKKAV